MTGDRAKMVAHASSETHQWLEGSVVLLQDPWRALLLEPNAMDGFVLVNVSPKPEMVVRGGSISKAVKTVLFKGKGLHYLRHKRAVIWSLVAEELKGQSMVGLGVLVRLATAKRMTQSWNHRVEIK